MDESNEPGATCQDCGFINPQSEEFCVACNAKIGSVRIGMKVDQEAGSGQYKQLKDKVDALVEGSLSRDQFTSWLEEISSRFTHKHQSLIDVFDGMNYFNDNPSECDMGMSGIEYFESGVNEFWAYLEDNDSTHLEGGLQMAWEGTQRIMEAMRINRESRAELAMYWDSLQPGETHP